METTSIAEFTLDAMAEMVSEFGHVPSYWRFKFASVPVQPKPPRVLHPCLKKPTPDRATATAGAGSRDDDDCGHGGGPTGPKRARFATRHLFSCLATGQALAEHAERPPRCRPGARRRRGRRPAAEDPDLPGGRGGGVNDLAEAELDARLRLAHRNAQANMGDDPPLSTLPKFAYQMKLAQGMTAEEMR